MRFLIVLLSLLLSLPARAAEVTVFAAASLAGPLDEIAELWERETGEEVVISYAGSSVLARQIEAGAPADLVILASTDWMDRLEAVAAIRIDTRRDLLRNRLVLIGSWHVTDEIALTDLPDLIGTDRLAVALTEAVPAGIYARAALEHHGLWEPLRPNIVEADNVRTAQAMVAIGAARFGIVYATDVAQERRVGRLSEIDTAAHPPIVYPMALTPTAQASAEAFAAFFDTPLARATFAGAGFGLVTP